MIKLIPLSVSKDWQSACGRLLCLFFIAVFLASGISFVLPSRVSADYPCPQDMSDLDCAAIYGNWVGWVPETIQPECSEGVTGLHGRDNIQKAFNYFIGKKLTPEQAAGILGNLFEESRLDPSIVQGGGRSNTPVPGKGYGIAQWTPSSRQNALVNFADSRDARVSTLGVQLDFIWQEATGKTPYKEYGNTIRALKKAGSVEQAALTFHKEFERSADTLSMIQERVDSAKEVLKRFGASVLPAAGSSASDSCSGGGSTFRLSSFNILYSTARANWQGRLQKSLSVIARKKFDVIGLQEVRPDQYHALKQALGSEYGFYPSPYGSRSYPSQNTIIWRKSRFDLSQGKTIAGYTVTSGPSGRANTQVKLRDKESDQEFYLINQHEPVHNGQGMVWRLESAKKRAAYVKNLKSQDDLPVFITGDFNSKYLVTGSANNVLGNNRNNLAYCVLTANNLLRDAYDTAKNRTGKCPSTDYHPPEGDHIFMSPDVKAKNYNYAIANNGSDHHTLSVDVTIPGGNLGVGKGRFTDGGKHYSGVQQMLERAKQLARPGSSLAATVCHGNCLGLCDRLAGGAWGYANSGFASAAIHWGAMKASGHAHPGSRKPPVGALLFYDTGRIYGHVAVYLGKNKVLSNDVLDSRLNRTGGAYITDTSSLESGPWQLRYLGWSDPIFRGSKL